MRSAKGVRDSIAKALGQRWYEALCSGHYAQGRGFLRRGDCYCPFGVLCDIYYPPGTWESVMIRRGIGEWIQAWRIAECSRLPPNEVVTAVGLDPLCITEITRLNDLEYAAFPVIAYRVAKLLKLPQ